MNETVRAQLFTLHSTQAKDERGPKTFLWKSDITAKAEACSCGENGAGNSPRITLNLNLLKELRKGQERWLSS